MATTARPALPASPTDDAPAWPDDAVEVARVLGAWGLEGAIRVKPFAADPQALFGSKRWFVAAATTPRPAGAPGVALPRLLRIVRAREQGDTIVATARELPDRDAAEALKGARIFVSRASFPTPAEGEFYWVDLIGLRVVNRQQQLLGTVDGLIETGPHCVLSLRGEDPASAPTLIPFVDAYVDRVDRERGVIEVDWGADY